MRDAAYNNSRVARSGFTRGRTTSRNFQRGSPCEDCIRGHARRQNVCLAYQSYYGTNRGHRMEQIPQHRRGQQKGGVLGLSGREGEIGKIRNLKPANGGIRVDR